jgi:hypothetical protein
MSWSLQWRCIVFFEVRTEFLNIVQMSSGHQMVNSTSAVNFTLWINVLVIIRFLDCHFVRCCVRQVTGSPKSHYCFIGPWIKLEIHERNKQPTFFTLFNSKLNSPLWRKLQNYALSGSECPNTASEYDTIVMFKSSTKQSNDLNKTCMYVHDSGYRWRLQTQRSRVRFPGTP